MRKVLEKCPTCGGELTITGLHCSSCHTRIESQYSTCRFCRLSQESLDFIEIFVRSRGNIREMERELGISYPTVRSRLNAVIEELGYEVKGESAPSDDLAERRREILQRLSAGEISATEAAELINQLKK
ncbi:MAG: DUF2089 domain-containing protein [Candidatus Poribacteria bacterium]|nr:DUF2089 domain-containing protein [Candidatus Poribacteria bacterium]